MTKLLTKGKNAWARQFKPKHLRGTALNPNISDALRYKRKLDKVIDIMCASVERDIKKLFNSETGVVYFSKDESISSQSRILTNMLMDKFNGLFASIAKPMAEQVVEGANKSSASSMSSSLKQLSGGLSINTKSLSPDLVEILNASVIENVSLIKSISEKYLSGVQGAVMRSITTGGGLQDLIPYLQKSKEITKRRAKMIAYDQTRKAFNALNRGRMDKLGIKEFEWLHSGGSNEPRKLHIELSGKIFSLDNLPVIDDNTGERGIPGQLINCRCRMLPIIKFNEE